VELGNRHCHCHCHCHCQEKSSCISRGFNGAVTVLTAIGTDIRRQN
jgi:hypothetical protein